MGVVQKIVENKWNLLGALSLLGVVSFLSLPFVVEVIHARDGAVEAKHSEKVAEPDSQFSSPEKEGKSRVGKGWFRLPATRNLFER